MARRLPLTLHQDNDETLDGIVRVKATELPQDLDAVELRMYIKASEETADSEATVLSTETGEITIVDEAEGTYTVDVEAAILAQAGIRWYRVDAIGAATRTVVYGPLTTQDL